MSYNLSSPRITRRGNSWKEFVVDIKVVSGDITNSKSGVIVVNYFEDSGELEGDMAAIDKSLGGALSSLITSGEIKGKFKEITIVYTLGKLPSSRIAVVGMGNRKELTQDRIRTVAAEVCRVLRQKSQEDIDSVMLGSGLAEIAHERISQAIAEGVVLGTYSFRRHLTKPPEYKDIKHFTVMEPHKGRAIAVEDGLRRGRIIAEACNLTRDMVNEPSNFMTPTDMANLAATLARNYGLEISVIDRPEMQKLGMGGLLGVSQGSAQPPKFIVLQYKGKKLGAPDIALVGKGITFDSGGISIKPSEGMGDMKGDMAGGASVMAAISVIAQLKPLINVAALIPATENLPSGTAYKPGDILTAMNGKTMEIVSTDAEGRVILADALSYARKMGATKIVDVATLTGACRIALGDICTGVFGNNQELIDMVISAGKEAGEFMWQMPMNDEYKELNKSDVADVRNTGGRWAGAITAALFLSEFVDTAHWVHLDVAGTSMTDKDRGYLVKGATGVPVRSLINLVLSLAKQS
jgi:leucyl aminopeptidase